MKNPEEVIKEFCVTEKATLLSANQNKYVFEVYRDANRHEVAKAIESVFGVKVSKVNTLNRKGKVKLNRMRKKGKTASKKLAIVSLKEGDKIELV